MTWPTRSDYIDRGAAIPSWAGGPPNTDLPSPDYDPPARCVECDRPLTDDDFATLCVGCREAETDPAWLASDDARDAREDR